MASLIGGAAAGAAFQEGFGRILEIIKGSVQYADTLQDYKTMLEDLRPKVNDMVRLNGNSDSPRPEVESLDRAVRAGEALVGEYSNKSPGNIFSFPFRQMKLQAADESVRRILSGGVQAQTGRDVAEILQKMNLIFREQFLPSNYGSGTALYGTPEDPDFVVGMNDHFYQLKCHLLNGSGPFLNLTGFGGSGKTTLAKRLCRDPQVLDKFKKNIFFATFSKTPHLKIIVEELFRHFGQPKPEFQINEDPRYKLKNMLEHVGGSPILLVLDDVYPGSEGLVEKFKVSIPDLKILVTSRAELNLASCITHPLGELSHKDSMTLFRHHAELEDTCPENDFADQIVRCCGGLPLILEIIGSRLRKKSIAHWQIMKRELLQRGGSLVNSDDEVLAVLKKCFYDLDGESIVKECFMDLGLFPEDQMIPVSALLDIWTEQHDCPEEFYARTYIDDLTSRNLSTLVVTREVANEEDNYYNNHFLMQHDLLRDLAIHLSNDKPLQQRENLIIDINKNDHPELRSEPEEEGIISSICHKLSITEKQIHVNARSVSISSGLISLSLYQQSHSLFVRNS